MSECLNNEILRQLANGELPEAQSADAEAHLINCVDCYQQWEALNGDFAVSLKTMSTVQPPPDLLKDYHLSLERRFASDSVLRRMYHWFTAIESGSGYLIRMAQVAAVFLLVFFAGRSLFNQFAGRTDVPVPAALPQTISFLEIETVSAFLLESELLLLQLDNTPAEEIESDENIEFMRSIAKNLASRSILIQAKAIEWNDLSLLRLISSLDVLFVELSNAESGEFTQRVDFVKEIVIEMDLLSQIRLAIEAAEKPQLPPMSI